MLPPHMPTRRKKIERTRPTKAAPTKPEPVAAGDAAPKGSRIMLRTRILGRAAKPSPVVAARERRIAPSC